MRSPRVKSRKRAVSPSLEGLETRELLSAVPQLHHVAALNNHHRLTTIAQIAATAPVLTSTIPANGDVNPYGLAFVPPGFAFGGPLHPGDILVGNFNSSANLQGTGTTIVQVTPNHQTSVFYQGPPGVGFNNGLSVLKRGFVVAAVVPSTDGTSSTAGQGSILVLDRHANVVANFNDANLLNGPWSMTVVDQGSRALVFVSNVLSGTVSRFVLTVPSHGSNIHILSATQIASGYTHRGDPAAFELGPAGLAYDARHNTLYVASSADNAIYAIPNASRTADHGAGRLVYQDNVHLHGPVGLTFAPDGNLITANGDGVNVDPNQPSELVEFTTRGQFVGQFSLNPNNGGAFNVLVSARPKHVLAAVNDNTSQLETWNVG